ncbi:MAG: endonuclease/exonuclease/phosphatase family protein [Ferrimonas sp.]
MNGIKIVSWNVQNGLNADQAPVLAEQLAYIEGVDADVVALQEVDQHYWASLQQYLPAYQWHFAAAVTTYQQGQLQQFGNVIGSRLLIEQWRSHCLLPAETEALWHMPRSVGELVISYQGQAWRILTCHLEFFCPHLRQHQLAQIQQIIDAGALLQRCPSRATLGWYQPLSLPVEAILCGDFNIADGSEEFFAQLQRPNWFDLGQPSRAPTCGIFDRKQWPQGADRRDFFFAIGAPMNGKVDTDIKTALSDHQPLFLTLTQ